MNHDGTKWGIYDDFLRQKRYVNKNSNIEYAQNSLIDLANNDASYQVEATRNGVTQPMFVIRNEDNIAKVTAMPTDELFVGDIVGCYGEYWLVVDAYRDEYGIYTGTMWLCNYLLKFQNGSPDVLSINCVVDDGAYSKLTQKSITTVDAQYTVYLPLTKDTEKFFIDKRFAIGTTYNKDGERILQVMKTSWIDKIQQNGAIGNHLLKIRLQADVYDSARDSLELMVCDIVSQTNSNLEAISAKVDNNMPLKEESTNDEFYINGKGTIRIGTTRTYTVVSETSREDLVWCLGDSDVSIESLGSTCKITVPLDELLVGKEITLVVKDNNDVLLCSKVIRVVTIG